MQRFARGLRPLLECRSTVGRGVMPAQKTAMNAGMELGMRHGRNVATVMRALHSTSMRSGVMDGIRGAMDTAMQQNESNKEVAAFAAQMRFLMDPKPIDAGVFLETLKELKDAAGLSGFREHLPWISNNPMLEDIKTEERIIGALTPEERRRPDNIAISSKKRVARDLNIELDQVDMFLRKVVMMRCSQRWIHKLMKEGKALPNSSAEMQSMMAVPGAGVPKPRSYQKGMMNPGLKERVQRQRNLRR